MPQLTFSAVFTELTGNAPFPWQTALYERCAAGQFPAAANIPTGLGKTSVVAIWLIALAQYPDRIPRRLVYVVNRRTVVDQTTAEVERLRKALKKPELTEVRNALASLCALPLPTPDAPLAISTLRGQFADNGEWCADPSRPAVIVGTVDIIGSGLLFSRYNRGFKTRPLHAGFLGQDVLLVHDEAHLEPAFQTLLEAIVAIQRNAGDRCKLRAIELTATSRASRANGTEKPFGLDENPHDKDTDNETVKKRITAAKRLVLIPITRIEDGKDKANDGTVRDKILECALARKDSHRAVVIFVRSVEAAVKIKDELAKKKCSVAPLTGTMRGKERDELVSKNRVFQRFLPDNDRADGVTPATGTVFLVATAAGEVGVNISADDLVCDLTTYENMVQRFGRMNRFGDRDDSEIVVIYRENLQANYDEGLEKAASAKNDSDKKVAAYQRKNQSILRVIKTLDLLKKLGGSASLAALNALDSAERVAAFSPPPKIRVATDIQFDAWTLTSVRSPIAGRPPVAAYLHGEAEWQPPETHVAWREELDALGTPGLCETYRPAELLEDFPLKPHELLRDTSERIHDQLVLILEKLQAKHTPLPNAWLVREDGDTEVFPLRMLADQETNEDDDEEGEEEESGESIGDAKKAEKARRDRTIALIANTTLILPASLGGIENGLFTPNAVGYDADVADIPGQRCRVWSHSPEIPAGHALIRLIDKGLVDEETDDTGKHIDRYWLWLEAKPCATNGARSNPATAETLCGHTAAVTANAAAIATKLFPDTSALAIGEPDLRRCIVVAARLHDLGKNRAQWQRNLGNLAYDLAKPETILAKSAPGTRPRTVAERYRHEFGSLNDASADAAFFALSEIEREIVLHVVAAHHGRARPHFPSDEIGDNATMPDADAIILATEIPRRFARLQQRFGRWGLAWLESLLRASDYAASAGLVATDHDCPTKNAHINDSSQAGQPPLTTITSQHAPTASLAVNPANPGHYFACCGLFELASRLTACGCATEPSVLAWFERDSIAREWRFHLANTPSLAELLEKITAAEITALNPDDATASPLVIGVPFSIHLDWWKTATRDTVALKVWAGTMECPRIARSMQAAVKAACASAGFIHEKLLLESRITYDSNNPDNKVEPFYFDANRGHNAHSRDVGFAANDLKLETLAAPAVELLSLVGLQRATPAPVPDVSRRFDYHPWMRPLPISLLATAVNGLLPDKARDTFRFESWFRTGQRKHKAFLTARTISPVSFTTLVT
ncbi:MAG: type I-G CRISPR-associated helicase/endonuclease Cas3g [Opitutaceae bacterium]